MVGGECSESWAPINCSYDGPAGLKRKRTQDFIWLLLSPQQQGIKMILLPSWPRRMAWAQSNRKVELQGPYGEQAGWRKWPGPTRISQELIFVESSLMSLFYSYICLRCMTTYTVLLQYTCLPIKLAVQ